MIGAAAGLRSPSADAGPTYEEFVRRLRRYTRTSLLDAGTATGWKAWSGSTVARSEHVRTWREEHLCRAYAGRVTAIAAAEANEHRDTAAGGEDVARLVHDFLAIQDPLCEPSCFEKECAELAERLEAVAEFHGRFADRQQIVYAATMLSMNRLARSQWEFRTGTTESLARTWFILKELDSRYGTNDRLKAVLMAHPRDVLRAGFGLLAIAGADEARAGRINLAEWRVSSDVATRLDLDIDALRQVASRFSWSCTEFRTWHNAVRRSTAEPYRKYVPHPLAEKPLIRLDPSFRGVGDERDCYLVPSPDHVLEHTRAVCIEAMRQLEIDGVNLLGELGPATEAYLEMMLKTVCGEENVLRIPASGDGKAADFFVAAGDLGLVIESKRALGSSWDKDLLTPASVVAIWRKLFEAYSQCAASARRKPWKQTLRFSHIDEVVCVVTLDDVLAADGATFNQLASKAGIIRDLGLGAIEPLSVSDLSDHLMRLGPVHLTEIIKKKWADGKHDHLLHTLTSQLKVETPFASGSPLAVYEDELWGRVLDVDRRHGRRWTAGGAGPGRVLD